MIAIVCLIMEARIFKEHVGEPSPDVLVFLTLTRLHKVP